MNAQAAADWLYNSIQAQDVLADPPNGLGANLKDAYAIQEALVARMEEDDGPAVGWKVALTSPVMQQMCGVDHPCEGAVLQARVHQSPAVCDTSKLGRLGVEAEIALVIDRDMPASSGPLHPGERRPRSSPPRTPLLNSWMTVNADYSKFTAAKLIANNSLNAGIVMGPALENWSGHDLSALKGAMLIDGEVIAEGTGADILGHPLNAIVWLSNSLNARGKMLRRGDVVMCGSFVRTQFPVAGQTVTCRVEALCEATLALR